VKISGQRFSQLSVIYLYIYTIYIDICIYIYIFLAKFPFVAYTFAHICMYIII